jgi:broad specificity phosphatase PhoE
VRVLEVRRHSYTKKGADRAAGSHLSQAGVDLARRVGSRLGPFDRVVASPVPRAAETALAMGFAVDSLCDALGPSDPDLFAEIGHHERWSWEEPFTVFAHLVRLNGPTARLGRLEEGAWRAILAMLPDSGRALVISHGRVIECGLVAIVDDADFVAWGPPFRHCEGVRITEIDGRTLQVELLRVDLTER